MAKYKFRLKEGAGDHQQYEGDELKVYRYSKRKDTIIPSDDPLDKMFPNKFERIGGHRSAERDDVLDRGDDESDVVPKKRKPMKAKPADDEEETDMEQEREDAALEGMPRGEKNTQDDEDDLSESEEDEDDLPELEDEEEEAPKKKTGPKAAKPVKSTRKKRRPKQE